jgi:hypothetical protein
MAERGIKAQGCFAEAFVGGTEHLVVGHAVADGKTASLLSSQVEMGEGELALLRVQLARRWALGPR